MNIMSNKPTIFGIICMAHAGLEHGGGFGLAARYARSHDE